MAIEKQYDLTGLCILLASIRQQDLVDGILGRTFFNQDLIKIQTDNQEINNAKAISLTQTSPGCFQLVFDCQKYKLKCSVLKLRISVFYDKKIRKTYDIVIKYPKQKASFGVQPSLQDINWGKQVPCGSLKVTPSCNNRGSEWWQYEKQECIYVAVNKNISIDGAQLTDYAGRKCFKIEIDNPRHSFNVPIKFMGKDVSLEGTELVTVSYAINNNWSIATFKVKGCVPSFDIDLMRISSVVSTVKETNIFKLKISSTNFNAPIIRGLKVKSSNDIISVKSCKENEFEYFLCFEGEKINSYPVNLKTTILVQTLNAGQKEVSVEIVPFKTKNNYQVQFLPCGLFDIDLSTQGYTSEEFSGGIPIGIRNNGKIILNNVKVSLLSTQNLKFTKSSSSHLSISVISPKHIVDERINCALISGKYLKADVSITIQDSDYNQIIPIKIPILQKRVNTPIITFKKIWNNSGPFNGDEVLLECIVENPLRGSDSKREIADISVSDLSCSNEFELINNSPNLLIRPGERRVFSIRLKTPCIQDCKKEVVIYFKNRMINKKCINFYHPEYTSKRLPLARNVKFPKGNFTPIPVVEIKFEETLIEGLTNDDLIVRLDPLVKIYKITSDGFFANENIKIFSEAEGDKIIYLDPNKFCNPLDPNVPSSIECVCEFLVNDINGVEKAERDTFYICPLETLPILEYQYQNKTFSIGENNLFPNIEISFAHSKVKEGRFQDFATIIVKNAQTIPYPIHEGKIKAYICEQFYGDYIHGKPRWIQCNIFKLSHDILALKNGAQTDLVLSIDFGEYQSLKTNISKINIPFQIGISIETIDGKKSTIKFKGKLREEIFGEWYALDLGTTGIVMSHKNSEGIIKPVSINKRHDEDVPLLETDPNIVSSIMGIHTQSETGGFELKLEEERDSIEFSELILPAAKFIVGQKEIPYISRLNDWSNLKMFNKDGFSDVTPDILISELYNHILDLISDYNIRRLTLTYPNTYTGEQVTHIKSLVTKRFPHLQSYVNAVPESDAVLAHYLTLRTNPGSVRRFSSNEENIIIYDMGAGTLDISYVEFRFDPKQRKGIASIVKKIGIPVAGNYLNLVIFEALKESLSSNNRQWDSKKRKSVIEDLKSSEDILSEKVLPYSFKEGLKNMSGEDIINSPFMSKYLDYCCSRVFEVLFGTKEWKCKINTFVFSGRASRFVPLRQRIEKELGIENSSQIIDTETISDSELKKCVAIGAIEYTNSYSSEDGLHQFKIESRNQYHKVYCIYQTYGDFANRIVKAAKLIDPNETEWDSVPVVNGTKSLKLFGNKDIQIHPESTKITLVQTLLEAEDIENLYTRLWFPNKPLEIVEDDCFVNEILSIPVYELGNNLNNVLISIEVDENNNIDLRINNSRYLGEKIRESIETNRYYSSNFTLESE